MRKRRRRGRKDDQNFPCQCTYFVKVKKQNLLCEEEDRREKKQQQQKNSKTEEKPSKIRLVTLFASTTGKPRENYPHIHYLHIIHKNTGNHLLY